MTIEYPFTKSGIMHATINGHRFHLRLKDPTEDNFLWIDGRILLVLDAVAASDDKMSSDDLVALDEALEKLSKKDKIKADLVKLRYFAGLTSEQAAEVLGVSPSTADRHWAYTRS